jgi:hypothetical protein
MKRIYTLCFALLALGKVTEACSWIPLSFCATSNARPDDVVISGRIVNADQDGIDLEVIDVLKGVETRQSIRIWDGTDFDCNGPFSMAAIDLGGLDDTIIVVLPLITALENTWDVLGDYRRPDYFGYTPELTVANGLVHGFTSGPYWSPTWVMPYQDLVSSWGHDADACVTLSVEAAQEVAPFVAYLDGGGLFLIIRPDMAPGATVRVHASNGQEVLVAKATSGSTRIDLGGGLAMGVYHVTLVRQTGARSSVRVARL